MVPPLEIFRLEADGGLVWCNYADSLEAAARQIEALRTKTPARFVVMSLQTGHRRIFGTSGGPASDKPKPSGA